MLKPRKKITRKEIKKDPLLEFIAKAEKWYSENQKYLLYGVAGVLVVVVFAILLFNSRAAANRSASAELGIAIHLYDNGQLDEALNKLLLIKDQFSGTHSADMASFYIGKIYLLKNDYENAEIYFSEAEEELENYELIYVSALAGHASCREKAGAYLEAARLYEKAANISKEKFLSDEYLLDAVGNYINGLDYKSARQALSRLERDKIDFQFRNNYDFYSSVLTVKGY